MLDGHLIEKNIIQVKILQNEILFIYAVFYIVQHSC